MSESLKSKAISGAKWNWLYNIGSYFISFFLSIILARLLEPCEFGILGMLNIFTAVAMVFINSGLSTAIIRTKDASPEDYSTVFYFNIFVSTGFYVILFFAAPLIANFFKEPILVPLTRLITLVFLINSFGIIQNAILIKSINFKKQTICNLSGLGVSAIISTIMAFQGFGVYSIVGQAVSQALVTNILFWITSKWRPVGGFKISSFKKLWSFGSKVLATSIVAQIVENIDNILIGKVFSAGQLGFYVRAKSSKQLPEQIFTGVLSSTSFAVLAKVSDDDKELRRLHLHFFKLGTYGFLPIIFGFIAVAKAFTIVLYSEKWLPSVPIFQVIALSSIAIFLGSLFSQTIMAKGDGKLYFRLTTGKKVLGLLSIPFGLFWGLTPFIWSFVIINLIGLLLDFYYTGRQVNVKMFEYLIYMIKPLILSVLMGLGVYFITYLPITSNFLMLLLQVFSGIVLYIVFSIILKIKEYYYFKDVFVEQISTFMKRIKLVKIK